MKRVARRRVGRAKNDLGAPAPFAVAELDELFRGFADPTRLRILSTLAAGELCVCDLVDLLALPQSLVSRHLAYVRRGGLVDVTRESKYAHYRLAEPTHAVHRNLINCVRSCFVGIESLDRERRRAKRACANARRIRVTDSPDLRIERGNVGEGSGRRLRILFLCTGNSARSQIAEALLARKGGDRLEAGSAGIQPRPAVHPDAIDALATYGIGWHGRQPKTIDAMCDQPWDFVITVCDRAKESCPTFPGHPIFAHWGMPDPAEIEDTAKRQQAFRETVTRLNRRTDLLLALPFESLERRALEERLRRIGLTTPEPASQTPR